MVAGACNHRNRLASSSTWTSSDYHPRSRGLIVWEWTWGLLRAWKSNRPPRKGVAARTLFRPVCISRLRRLIRSWFSASTGLVSADQDDSDARFGPSRVRVKESCELPSQVPDHRLPPGGMLEAEGEAHLRAVVDQLEDIVVLVTLLVLAEVGEMGPVCRSERSWAYREMPGTWREHPKPPARAVEC